MMSRITGEPVTKRIFYVIDLDDRQALPPDGETLMDLCCTVNSGCYGQGNDSYFPWEVKYNDEETKEYGISGAGYITWEQEDSITKRLIEMGAKEGEEVLLCVSW